MKYTGLYEDPMHPVAQHIAELCRKFNSTSDISYLDMLRGAVNMAHTFGLGVKVFQDKVKCTLIYVSVHDYDTDEVLLMSCVENPFQPWQECEVYISRSEHGYYLR